MNFRKRVLLGITTGVIALSALSFSTSAYGGDNNIGYSFDVPANQGFGYSAPQYRGPSGTNVPWKVNFTYSSEGVGTYMYYFLAGDEWINKSRFSDYKKVQQGSGEKYFRAYEGAYNKNVRLGAQNNNDSRQGFKVSGYWDEESAKHNFSYWD